MTVTEVSPIAMTPPPAMTAPAETPDRIRPRDHRPIRSSLATATPPVEAARSDDGSDE
jgi:hypothetical protein